MKPRLQIGIGEYHTMSRVALGLVLAMDLAMIYLSISATWCIVRDRSLSRGTVILRILVSWLVPILGPLMAIRIAEEESGLHLRSIGWLRPLRLLLSDEPPDRGFASVIDVRADGERILPGSTFIPPQ